MRFLLALLLLSLSACESPLLDHVKEASFKKLTGSDSLTGGKDGVYLQKLGLHLKLGWIHGPYGDPTLESSLELLFKNREGQWSDLPEEIEVIHYAYMPSMGHGPADEGYLVREHAGHYLLKELFFSMPGDWTLTFEFWCEGIKLDEKVIHLYL